MDMKCKVLILALVVVSSTFLTVTGAPQSFASKWIRQALAQSGLYDEKHGVKMGVPNGGCDDAKTNLKVDWNGDAMNFTCFNPQNPLIPDPNVKSKLYCDNSIPKNYYPQHFCMDQKIEYNELLPTYGNHRPLWPVYGEYRFVPKERWLHNIEHGAIVMLYDPCVHHEEVDKLKDIVRSCIRKHIITPTTFLSKERPLALITWGCSLEMSSVDEKEVTKFIRERGLHGPEGDHPRDGQYDYMLIMSSAKFHGVETNDMTDPKSELCSKYPH